MSATAIPSGASAFKPGGELLRITDLHAFYGESHILHGIDLTVNKGELVTLLGRNGAGRSTTMKSILGLVGVTGSPMRTHASPLVAATMRNGARRANQVTSSAFTLRPIKRFTPNTVLAGLETACRCAGVPTTTAPLGDQLTHDGMVREPSSAASTRGTPRSSSAATQEFVVPRSMPMMRDTSIFLVHELGQQTFTLVGGHSSHFRQFPCRPFV